MEISLQTCYILIILSFPFLHEMLFVANPTGLDEPVNLELNLSRPLFLQEPCPNQLAFFLERYAFLCLVNA